jgi:hypothetical protein
MGIETSKAVLARRRESAQRISRLVAEAEERNPATAARRHRVSQSLRLARRRLRALAEAQRTTANLEVEIGQVLMAVEVEGMSRNDVFARVGLPRHVGRKYVAAAMAAQDRLLSRASTGEPTEPSLESRSPDLGLKGRRPDAATKGSL